MKEFKSLKTPLKVLLIISMLFTIIGLIASLIGMNEAIQLETLAPQVFYIILYIFIAIYAGVGYKKPHGNSLKYLMLLFDLSLFFRILYAAKFDDVLNSVIMVVSVIGIAYMAGRLDRIKENQIYMTIILILLGYEYVLLVVQADFNSFFTAVPALSPIIIWIVICSAYYARYYQHKNAGILEDKSKKK